MSKQGYIYLLHFSRPVAPGRHTCQHYTGFCYDLWARIRCHLGGNAARLTEVAHERGIGMKVVRVWKGTGHDERRIKNRKEGTRLCPICTDHPKPVNYLKELTEKEIQDLIGPLYC